MSSGAQRRVETPLAAPDVTVLINPSAGRGRHARAVSRAIEVLTGSGLSVRLLDAATRDDALRQCHEAVAGATTALVAVGGDGTVHLGVQAIAGTGVGFGIVPAGTGNDFAAAVGVEADPVAAATAIVTAIRTGHSTPFDLALVTRDDGYRAWFAAILAAGFDALVNERANATRWPRGRLRYDLAIMAELLRLRGRRYQLTLDGQASEVDACLVAVGNTASYGGGLRMCPDADPHDGMLDVVVGGPISRATLVRLRPRLAAGTHLQHPKVTTYRVKEVKIRTEGIVAYADGERLCPLPASIVAVPAALRLLTA